MPWTRHRLCGSKIEPLSNRGTPYNALFHNYKDSVNWTGANSFDLLFASSFNWMNDNFIDGQKVESVRKPVVMVEVFRTFRTNCGTTGTIPIVECLKHFSNHYNLEPFTKYQKYLPCIRIISVLLAICLICVLTQVSALCWLVQASSTGNAIMTPRLPYIIV